MLNKISYRKNMANNKKKNLNNINSELPKKRGNPNFIKKQNEIIKEAETKEDKIKEIEEKKEKVIEEVADNQIINDNNNIVINDNIENNDNILITDNDYNDINEDLDSINSSQETSTKKVKKNSSLYELLSRPFGATMEELEKELNWKKASIRGTISNLQKEQQFCLMTINVIKPNLKYNLGYNLCSKSFYKETRYFIKDCEFTIDEILKK